MAPGAHTHAFMRAVAHARTHKHTCTLSQSPNAVPTQVLQQLDQEGCQRVAEVLQQLPLSSVFVVGQAHSFVTQVSSTGAGGSQRPAGRCGLALIQLLLVRNTASCGCNVEAAYMFLWLALYMGSLPAAHHR